MTDTLRVLHVDDDPGFGEVTAEFLERGGEFEVTATTGVSEALDLLAEAAEFDCVVSDYDMPGTDGLEFLDTVRESHPDIPFILFTGKGSEEVASDAIAAGVTDYLRKRSGTGQYELLANRIRNAVETYRTRREREQITERVTDAIITVDADWQVTFVDERTEELYDPHVSEFVGREYWDIFPATRGTRFEEEYRRVMETREPTAFETQSTVLDRWFHIEAYPDDDGGISIYYRDITDRKERERELEAARERMEFALDVTDSIIYEMDLETGEQTRHGPFERLYGVDPDRVPASEAFYEHAVHPDDRDRVRELQRTVGPDDTLEFEYRTHPDYGEVRWLRAEAYVRSGSEGESLVGLATDVTDRKERERALERERDRYAALFENLPNPVVYGVAEEGDPVVRSVNPAFEETFGCDAADVEGENLHEFILPPDHDEAAELNRRVLREGTVQTEVRRATDDGERTFRLDIAVRNPDDDTPEGYAIYTDITAREAHERRLARLHEATRDLIGADSSSRVATVASETAEDILEFPMNGIHFYDEAAGGLAPAVVSEGSREVLGDPPVLDEGIAWDAFDRGEVRIHDDVREATDCYRTGTPIRSEMCLPLGDHGVFIISSTEVGAFDEADIALAKTLAANVESALDRMAHERALERKTEQLDEFASVVSHDLRNPLNTLELSLDIAERTGEGEHFDRCHRAIDRMERLIEDLLTLARRGDTVDEVTPVDLDTVAEACWRTVETGDARLRTDAVGTVMADENRLRQLLENLIRNAVEHGGPDVTVTVGDLAEGFYVADDGPGIPSDRREKVFASGYTTSDEGTGFGLAIVEEIADAHGWTVTATESADGGTRFEITGVETCP